MAGAKEVEIYWVFEGVYGDTGHMGESHLQAAGETRVEKYHEAILIRARALGRPENVLIHVDVIYKSEGCSKSLVNKGIFDKWVMVYSCDICTIQYIQYMNFLELVVLPSCRLASLPPLAV